MISFYILLFCLVYVFVWRHNYVIIILIIQISIISFYVGNKWSFSLYDVIIKNKILFLMNLFCYIFGGNYSSYDYTLWSKSRFSSPWKRVMMIKSSKFIEKPNSQDFPKNCKKKKIYGVDSIKSYILGWIKTWKIASSQVGSFKLNSSEYFHLIRLNTNISLRYNQFWPLPE